MGCGQSKLELNEETPARLRPSPVAWRRFHIRKNVVGGIGRNRKDCRFVTASELMKEDSEAGDVAGAEQLQTAGNGAKPVKTAEEEEEERRKRKRCVGMEGEEELPGSPSFRFYFAEGAPPPKWMGNDANVVAAGNVKDHAMLHEDNIHRREDSSKYATSSEESESKSAKKDKTSKFKVLAKGSSVVYNTVLGR